MHLPGSVVGGVAPAGPEPYKRSSQKFAARPRSEVNGGFTRAKRFDATRFSFWSESCSVSLDVPSFTLTSTAAAYQYSIESFKRIPRSKTAELSKSRFKAVATGIRRVKGVLLVRRLVIG